jgi:ubiquinone/menaquinone biosynthesis C-methylase UbiE
MQQKSLYDCPDLHNLMARRDPIFERFYVEIACERGGRVLDLACGTGRLTKSCLFLVERREKWLPK